MTKRPLPPKREGAQLIGQSVLVGRGLLGFEVGHPLPECGDLALSAG